MKRRTMLLGAGTASVVALAGCLGVLTDNNAVAAPDYVEIPDDPEEIPRSTRSAPVERQWEFAEYDTVELGDEEDLVRDRTRPSIGYGHCRVSVNNVQVDGAVEIGVVDSDAETVMFFDEYDLPTDHAVEFVLHSPATHIIHVRLSESELDHLSRIPEDAFENGGGGYWNIDLLARDTIESSFYNPL